MKFAKRLTSEAVPEWRPKYLQYKQLKKLIKIIPAHSLERDVEKDAASLSPDEVIFIQELDGELTKIDEFYQAREREAIERKARILVQLHLLLEDVRKMRVKPKGGAVVGSAAIVGHMSGDTTISPHLTSPALVGDGAQLTWRSLPLQESSPSLVSPGGTLVHTNISSLRDASFTRLARLRIKKALLEFYRFLELLRNFKSLNIVAVGKILKKFDKRTGRRQTAAYAEKLRSLAFCTNNTVDELLGDVEDVYRFVFTEGDRVRALRKLRVKNLKMRSYHGTALLAGMLLMACVVVTWRAISIVLHSDLPTTKALGAIYYGLGMPFLLAWLFALNAQIWEAHYINYRFVFEYNQRSTLHVCQYAALVGFYVLLYVAMVLVSLLGWLDGAIKPLRQPWAVLAIWLAIFLWPGPQLHRSSRIWLARVMMRIIATPFYPCRFKDFFLNDQYMSLLITFDAFGRLIHHSVNVTVTTKDPWSRPAVWYIFALQMLPAWWRSLQCIRRYRDSGMASPHLINLAKYLCCMCVPLLDGLVLLTPFTRTFLVAVIVMRVISSTFTLTWDILMDFGLWTRSPMNDVLRRTILFRPCVYWYLVVSDGIARFLWVMPLILLQLDVKINPFVMILALGTVEVLRRAQWNIFRVEYEHVNNCNGLRAVADVPLPFTATDLFYQDMVEMQQRQQQVEDEQQEILSDEEETGEPEAANAKSSEDQLSSDDDDINSDAELTSSSSSFDLLAQSQLAMSEKEATVAPTQPSLTHARSPSSPSSLIQKSTSLESGDTGRCFRPPRSLTDYNDSPVLSGWNTPRRPLSPHPSTSSASKTKE